ncbi:NADH-cytochrome b5 reductase 2 [Hypsizygus marmoreus]|uniref:NADH-cytochrome b5 reductase 2 n=1 Tax=Hypsizygus marmoreus TaxID=39966 RepID=A0A369JKS7_HYPMA|nr:NADH-cytochrome b5 reductase 2 [Hypsizygus marmoreus]
MNRSTGHRLLCELRRTTHRFYSQSRSQPRRTHLPRTLTFALGLGAIGCTSLYFFYPDPSRSAPTSAKVPLSPSHFTPAIVLSNELSGPDTKLLQVTVAPDLLPPNDPANPSFAPIWSVYIKDDDIQVERPYTPLEGIDERGCMLFWIKKYPKGEVGRWLHAKRPGDQIALRGPLATWPWKEGVWDEVVMISGGTGITPFYQLFHSVISRQTDQNTRFTLLHSSRTPADIPPPHIMDPLTNYAAENSGRFRLGLFVDSFDGPAAPSHLPKAQIGRIGRGAIEQSLGLSNAQDSWWTRIFGKTQPAKPVNGNILFLVCGPDPMISAIAGPYGRNFSQGPVGGVLREMGIPSKQVWKL